LFLLLGVYMLSCYDVLEADTMNSMSNMRGSRPMSPPYRDQEPSPQA